MSDNLVRAAVKFAADIRAAFRLSRPTAEPDAGTAPEEPLEIEVELEDPLEAPTIHALKCWPRFFEALADGSKTFEFRDANDRAFEVGDLLQLYEWEPGYAGAAIGETTIVPGRTGRSLFLEVLGVSILAGQVRFDSGPDDAPSLTLAGRLAVLSVRLVPPFPTQLEDFPGAFVVGEETRLAEDETLEFSPHPREKSVRPVPPFPTPKVAPSISAGFVLKARVRRKLDPDSPAGTVEKVEGSDLGIRWDDDAKQGFEPGQLDIYGIAAAVQLLEVIGAGR